MLLTMYLKSISFLISTLLLFTYTSPSPQARKDSSSMWLYSFAIFYKRILEFKVSIALCIQGRSSLFLPFDAFQGLSDSVAFPFLLQYAGCLEVHLTSSWL